MVTPGFFILLWGEKGCGLRVILVMGFFCYELRVSYANFANDQLTRNS